MSKSKTPNSKELGVLLYKDMEETSEELMRIHLLLTKNVTFY